MNKPTHRACPVEAVADGSDRKARWTEVGVVWPHKNGTGFDVVLPPGLSVAGRIVCVTPKEAPADTGDEIAVNRHARLRHGLGRVS